MKRLTTRPAFALALACACAFFSRAQSPPPKWSPEELRQEMIAADAALFSAAMGAYGRCEIEKAGAMFAEDAEFFHDHDGLLKTRATIMTAMRNVCGTHRRELVAGSLEVHPLPGYGAMAVGMHRFYHMENGKEVGGTVAAKFLHVWRYANGKWELTRVISYAH